MALTALQTLCTLSGISGREHAVRDWILQQIAPYADSVTVDPLGNVIAEKKGANRAKQKLMVSAHMDEVGMLVTYITEDGKLKFTTVGGIDKRILPGKQVFVGNTAGVIGLVPVHLLSAEEKGKAVSLDRLCIDIGAKTKAEAEAVVQLGDAITFAPTYFQQGDGIFAKALDDRVGCAILLELLKEELPYDVTFVFCVQEEVGLRGATTAAYTVNPDSAIVVETTTAADLPTVAKEKQVCYVGKGPVVSFMDRATIYDKDYFHLALSLAKEKDIPVQVKQAVAGGNDAGAIHQSRGGVRTLAVSLACRYLHGPLGHISSLDYHHTKALVKELITTISGSEQP